MGKGGKGEMLGESGVVPQGGAMPGQRRKAQVSRLKAQGGVNGDPASTREAGLCRDKGERLKVK